MILSLLGSKVGIALVALAICAAFFGFAKWKHKPHPKVAAIHLNHGTTKRSNSEAALAASAQENAIARADDVRTDRRQGNVKGESFDEAGNIYQRRAVPEPLTSTTADLAQMANTGGEAATPAAEDMPVTSLRIHGRRAKDPDDQPSKLTNSLAAFIPSGLKPSTKTFTEPAPLPKKEEKPQRFVPFGRLIKAELVMTLESTQDQMPLIGLITEPVYNNGRLVIPAGTELHSMARPDRVRDRIVSMTVWRLIFPREGNKPNGRQLVFNGMALDREDRDGNGLTWGVTDGSYGLRGRTIHNGQTTEALMLFAAEAIKAASASLMDRQETLLGTQVQENARNASLAGGQAVLSHFAEGIAKELERNGTYIQVPAGKEFYVYPQQVIDPDRADIPDDIAKVE